MTAKKLVIILAALFGIALILGIVGFALEWFGGEPVLERTAGGITLAADPAHVRMELAHEIHFKLNLSNSGDQPVKAWALDLGKGLYLIEAKPRELLYHKGHAQSKHGNVLIYATPIEPGSDLELDLTLRVLFDSDGNFDPDPWLKLSYARSTKDAQSLAVTDLQEFQDSFVTFPSAETGIHIEP